MRAEERRERIGGSPCLLPLVTVEGGPQPAKINKRGLFPWRNSIGRDNSRARRRRAETDMRRIGARVKECGCVGWAKWAGLCPIHVPGVSNMRPKYEFFLFLHGNIRTRGKYISELCQNCVRV